jgi:regulation of enolase protein 1 (concanavalin A-like superfamily)
MTFIKGFNYSSLFWLNNPNEWGVVDSTGLTEGSNGSYEIIDESNNLNEDKSILKLLPPSKKDFWSRTFYDPLLIKSDATALLCKLDNFDEEVTIKVDFEYTPQSQFDQGDY